VGLGLVLVVIVLVLIVLGMFVGGSLLIVLGFVLFVLCFGSLVLLGGGGFGRLLVGFLVLVCTRFQIGLLVA